MFTVCSLSVVGTPFTVQFNGQEFECKNWELGDRKITASEKRNPQSVRCRYLPDTNRLAAPPAPIVESSSEEEITEDHPAFWEELQEVRIIIIIMNLIMLQVSDIYTNARDQLQATQDALAITALCELNGTAGEAAQ